MVIARREETKQSVTPIIKHSNEVPHAVSNEHQDYLPEILF